MSKTGEGHRKGYGIDSEQASLYTEEDEVEAPGLYKA